MDQSSAITDHARLLLSQTGFPDSVTVNTQYDSASDLYQVLIQTDEPALLIGYHGENLSALQLILGQHLHVQFGAWVNLSLNVNDYRQRRETALQSLAESAVARVVQTGQPHSLPPMPSNERRIVHLYLADHPDVATYSDGQAKNRSVIIAPRESQAGE
ncbi:MAG: hypothetical protein UX87_C0005G0012 [Candidatus Amesbacteria bacterium GW2011_GWA1_47_16]|uniref:R3H domain-containing protein n=4 Tax=Candidatus Amesiibacteriota TaxID=1752730 RepID=A0A0G1UEL5_9BACT|nr:MAG: hypothetical protein UX86_C0007G0015 [Candidatus Amesbacteria bacterium GW2011_GWC1_47_15]KKU64702.1 MAG: hypothetical protein UX87_C0005G0012 [Candidatus Amesbacteria bacterium GW2011_GWA1_47_16]KKU98239.1 MAG: hypothetical protein UY28_C0005G0014 [Candidatus Amesbacteria bacterium GW2011_GWB1_48_13]OGC99547.1 MAG: hypothetical protein A2701_03500 [Candidatus Amesbacteria bacterium RIFCSPHIGHO2_01_FULL_47_34]OGD01088.1 MAG: hypothetical protein A2972_04355 [Candidatus Amesbacteria bact